jgi:hypothetical protein
VSSRGLLIPVVFGFAVFIAVPLLLAGIFQTWRASAALPAPRTVTVPRPPTLEPPPPPPAAEPEVFPALRPVDDAAMAVIEAPMSEAIRPDVTPSAPYRIQLERGENGVSAGKLRIDLDRDGAFDEQWTLGSPIVRDVSPADDGNYTEHTVWTPSGWQAAPG